MVKSYTKYCVHHQDTQKRLLTMIEEAEKRENPYGKHTAMREKYGIKNTEVDPKK